MNLQDFNHTNRDQNYRRWLMAAVVPLVSFGATIGGMSLVSRPSVAQSVDQSVEQSVSASPAPKLVAQSRTAAIAATAGSSFIADAVERVGPAVVRIDASRTVKSRRPAILDDPTFRQFFGDDFGGGAPQERQESGVGSGFIISGDGLVMTNAHVIDQADTVTVTLRDGREYSGKVLGADPLTDLAVIRIQANNLPVAPLGNSDQLRPGEWAIAIGNPLGLDNTVTAGIISATARSSADVGIPDKRVGFIQTDAAINPGNSGGPLLNQRGEVIGVNTAIRRQAQGLGFSIPINTAQRITQQLIAKGRVSHPYLGIQMRTLTANLKKQLNDDADRPVTIKADKGVLVYRIARNTPAAKAGIRRGDVIVKLNNTVVTTAEDVQNAVERIPVGTSAPVEVNREGQTLTLSVQPGEFPTQLLER
jgi:Do/DeqQ family serine protease